jgi:hypothetical protein
MRNRVIIPMVQSDSVLLDNGYNERFYRVIHRALEDSRARSCPFHEGDVSWLHR